ncbi:MAG: energy transducer TonB [Chitinophagaceae bacterium]
MRLICTAAVFLLVVAACNNDAKQGNNATTETVTDTATVVDNNTVIPSTKTDTLGTRTAKKIGKVTIKPVPVDRTTAMKTDNSGYYNYTETAPSFPGGQSALENYIIKNIEYPQEAIDNSTEGTVYVMFTIDENGKVANAKTTGTALGSGLEEEAIKVVNNMSNWSPGMVKGKRAKAWYTLPITFRLEG